MRYFNLWIIIIKKNTYSKTTTFYCFNAVKDEKLFVLVKIEIENQEKRFYKDRPFKEGDKVCYSLRIEEAEGRKNLYHLVPKGKNSKAPNMKDMNNIILFAKY